jgi:quinoprotein glucose dehydrogenase
MTPARGLRCARLGPIRARVSAAEGVPSCGQNHTGVQRRLATIFALLLSTACSGSNAPSGAAAASASPAPSLQGDAGADWLAPGKTFAGNRLTALTQITPANVATLKKAWVTQVRDDGEEEASPIVSNGVVYVSTSHDNVLALDGTTGTLKWA